VKYYEQYPERGFPNLSAAEGKVKAKEQLEYLNTKIKGSRFLSSRNAEDQIRPFLDLEEPLEPFYEAVSVLKEHYVFTKRERPELPKLHEIARNIVLFLLILEKPIRSKNLAKLKFDKNLYKKKDGRYELYIPASEVKNNKEIKKTLSAELSRWIDIYRNEHYKKLNSKATDFVFISDEDIRYSASDLSKMLGRLCLELIGIETRCHAFRHLRASAYLLKFPMDYVYVAELLNDDLKTVIRRYVHINGRTASANDDEHLLSVSKKFGN
jgi:integrase